VSSPEWEPPGGWWPWLALMLAGALLLVAVRPLERSRIGSGVQRDSRRAQRREECV